jgi:hypothetical protein
MPLRAETMKFPVFYPVTREQRAETGSLETASSSGESTANLTTVASRVEDPTAMRSDQAINNDPVGGEGSKGADLIELHQAAVALDIRCEDRRELATNFGPVPALLTLPFTGRPAFCIAAPAPGPILIGCRPGNRVPGMSPMG